MNDEEMQVNNFPGDVVKLIDQIKIMVWSGNADRAVKNLNILQQVFKDWKELLEVKEQSDFSDDIVD